jgi:hypothetical protein
LLTTFTSNPDVLLLVLQLYSELALKYFRDIDVRKLLASYFEAYPFHEGLFFALLRFYRQHVELKENSKDNKYITDQFIEALVNGLRRALETSPERYSHISKLANKIMREYLGSIYAIKTAERKIKEMETYFRREGAGKSLKREREGASE